MEIGTVVGSVWATKKSDQIIGQKLLVIEMMEGMGERCGYIVAADTIGAGIGDQVLICQGRGARLLAGDEKIPVDASVAGIIDSLDIPKETSIGSAFFQEKQGGVSSERQ